MLRNFDFLITYLGFKQARYLLPLIHSRTQAHIHSACKTSSRCCGDISHAFHVLDTESLLGKVVAGKSMTTFAFI